MIKDCLSPRFCELSGIYNDYGELASRRDIPDPRIGYYTYLLDPNGSSGFSYGLGLALQEGQELLEPPSFIVDSPASF